MAYFDLFDPFGPWLTSKRPSVYVISDSELKAYKEQQIKAEVLELKRLIDYHTTSADNLKEQVEKIEAKLTPTPDKELEGA